MLYFFNQKLLLVLWSAWICTAIASCGDDEGQTPAVVMFEEGTILSETDTLLVAMAIAHRSGSADDTPFFSYDQGNQLTSVDSPLDDYSLEYDSEGLVTKMNWPDNEISYEYQVGRLIRAVWSVEGQPLHYYRYLYNNQFRLQIVERYSDAEERVRRNRRESRTTRMRWEFLMSCRRVRWSRLA